MKVYDEQSEEMVDVNSSDAQLAAEIAHGLVRDASGNVSHYRVERRPGEWWRFAVSMEMQPVFTTRGKGACDPPPSEDDEETEEMDDE